MNQSHQRVVVLGASDKADRYSNQAFRLLKKMGHDPVPVNRNLDQIDGVKVLGDLSEISGHVDTLTMYVNATISTGMIAAIINLKPDRVIFNPGTENPALQRKLDEAGIDWESACTLVLLNSGQF